MPKQQTKLKVAMVGGGLESFSGRIHRAAIEESDCLELVCGAFGSTRQRSFEAGKALQLDPKRVYGVYRDMMRREGAVRDDTRIDFVTVIAPNNMHYPVTMAAFDNGFPVFSEKPMSCNMDEAQNLKRRMLMNQALYTTCYPYVFYPALQKLSAAVADGLIGTVRRVDVRYYHGWMGRRLETAGNRSASWRVDPRRCGSVGAITDLGGPCALVAEWASGLEIAALCAVGRPTVAGRTMDDDATILLRFDNGALGTIAVSQIALGEDKGVELSIYGDKGSVHWTQSTGDIWTLVEPEGQVTVKTVRGATKPTQAETRFGEPYGDDAAYISALASAYREFAARVVAHQHKKEAPNNRSITVDQALRIATFNNTAARSLARSGDGCDKWTELVVPNVELLV